MIQKVLGELGLSVKELTVYMAVLDAGKVSPARLSTLTGLHRTTVYGLISELSRKGYLAVDELKGLKYVSPVSPEELLKIAKRERYLVAQKEEKLHELAQALRETPQSKHYAIPKIKFIEGTEKIAEYLYAQTQTWFTNVHQYDGTWVGFQDHTFVEVPEYREWVVWCTKRSDFVDTRLLSNDSSIENTMRENQLRARAIKFWPEVKDFSASQWIAGDYSIMLMTREKPHYLVEMHDAVYTSNMRKFFLGVFNSLP